MMLCECGEFIEGSTFRAFIDTSANPSTPTIGHCKCGLIFNFVDGKAPKKYSSKKDLKALAVRFAIKRNVDPKDLGKYLLEVDRVKSSGKLPDAEVLVQALIAMQ